MHFAGLVTLGIIRRTNLGGETARECSICCLCQSFSVQAEHEGTILALNASLDGYRIGVCTSRGNLGVLDLLSKSYQTLARSHTQVLHDQHFFITLG